MPEETKAQIVQKQIPVEKLLMQYGKSQIQLIAAEEELNQARAIIQSLQTQVTQMRAQLANAKWADNPAESGAATNGKETGSKLELVPANPAQA